MKHGRIFDNSVTFDNLNPAGTLDRAEGKKFRFTMILLLFKILLRNVWTVLARTAYTCIREDDQSE